MQWGGEPGNKGQTQKATTVNSKTETAYRKRAAFFYTSRIDGQPTTKKIKDALTGAASDYRPAYWRQLRNAICLDQREKRFTQTADEIETLKNPLSSSNDLDKRKLIPSKKRAVKKVNSSDIKKIFTELKKKRDPLLESALILAIYVGCRPAEMESITILDEDKIHIIGAKKRAEGDRGIDRIIQLPNAHTSNVKMAIRQFQAEINHLNKKGISSSTPHILERRLSTLSKRIWPRKKYLPTLYSFRHQFCADLKKADTPREEIAYLMGHRATKSADSYGNRKSGGGRSIVAGISSAEIGKLIKVDHHPSPFQRISDPSTAESNQPPTP
jgi:integrase